MTSRISCSACGASNGEFAARCAECDSALSSVSLRSTAGSRRDASEVSLEGCEVGPYRVEKQLGAGATGAVYKATDGRLLRSVALKVLSERLAPSERARGRMLREARAAARLKSRHVVQVLDHGVWRDRPYIAMEHLDGQTLRARLATEPRLSPAEAVRWITHIAAGLEKAHAAGVVHRDLKPENVFLARDEEGVTAKILDFGVAKAASSLADVAATHAGTLIGTPAYMSPEQANGVATLDHRSDLWSLGVIAFECVTGRRPFDRKELGALCVQILSEPLPVPSAIAPGIPRAFDAWWSRAAARDPAQRFQSAGELSGALSDALSGGAESPGWTLPQPAESSPPPPRNDKLYPRIRTGIIGLLAALLAGGIAAFSLQGRANPPNEPPSAPPPISTAAFAEPVAPIPASEGPPTPALSASVAPALSASAAPAESAVPVPSPPTRDRSSLPAARSSAPSKKTPSAPTASPSPSPAQEEAPRPEPAAESHTPVPSEPGMWNQRD